MRSEFEAMMRQLEANKGRMIRVEMEINIVVSDEELKEIFGGSEEVEEISDAELAELFA